MIKSESVKLNERMKKIIPVGSSTNSKAPRLMPDEPGVIVKGDGCRVWDADGREYIDFRNSLGPVTIGYNIPEINEAVIERLNNGIIFGHPHPIEGEVAEMIKDIVPCAEMVRFLKTGGEAAAALIRLARAYTGRDHIIQIGYNGWINTLAPKSQILPGQISEDTPAGVPACYSALHHACAWNDTEGIRKLFENYGSKIAAVIVSADYPQMEKGKTFYPFLREITNKNGSVLIFDEIVTGFRIALGGVQEYFNVTPDLAVFGKGMANGMPLSAYMGKREIMSLCDRGGKVVISSTFGGETLSLAASKAAISFYKKNNVVDFLWQQGNKLWNQVNELFEKYDIDIKMVGPAPTKKFTWNKELINEFYRAAYRKGVSLRPVSYINYSHKDEDVKQVIERLDSVCAEITRGNQR